MRNKIFLIILCTALCLSSGCVQKVKINLLKPGEVKLTGLSKIAVLQFNSIKSNIGSGRYAADSRICELARRCVTDSLYKEPYFQLVDLDLEKNINRINRHAKLKARLDGVLYGQVWWQISEEYENYTPSKMSLSKRKAVRYVCGKRDDGSAIYCTTHLLTRQWDEFYKSHYRAVTASLMMSLSVYRLGRNGRIEKVAQVFEIGRKPAVIENGQFTTNLKLIGFKNADDRTKVLKTDEDSFGFGTLSSMLGLTTKSEGGTSLDTKVTNNNHSIPAPLNLENCLSQAIAGRLKAVIQPHSEIFDVVMHGKDKKTQTLFITEAYKGLTKYLALKITDGNLDLADDLLENLTFEEDVKESILRKLKKDHERSQAELPASERVAFVQPSQKELTEEARSELSDMTNEMYNLALAFEGLGDFDRAIEIYRFGFNSFESTDQDMADGIGRCALALDSASRVIEELNTRDDAKDKTKLGH